MRSQVVPTDGPDYELKGNGAAAVSAPRTREEAEEADRTDPLASYRDQFVVAAGGPIYLDGNSLGRPPRAAAAAVSAFLSESGSQLIGGWDRWADLPSAIGDRIGQLVGAAPGQVVVSDSTTVNLYKLAVAALDARPGRSVVLGDANDFPTVRYVLQGIAARGGHHLGMLATDPVEGVGPSTIAGALSAEVALVCLSAVNYPSGAIVDMAAVNAAAHEAGPSPCGTSAMPPGPFLQNWTPPAQIWPWVAVIST